MNKIIILIEILNKYFLWFKVEYQITIEHVGKMVRDFYSLTKVFNLSCGNAVALYGRALPLLWSIRLE